MLDIIAGRRSIRKFKDIPVSEDLLMKILDSGRLAPSDTNTQPWHFIVVQTPEMRARLATVSHDQQWMCAAPVFIVCVADLLRSESEDRPPRIDEQTPGIAPKQIILDTAIAAQTMVLAAESQGLGTCWVSWFVQDEIRPVLGLPDDKYVVAILTLGYPDQKPNPRPRRPLEDVVRRERW